jgi:oligopeptide/dipeptide ABC transporter ATP-binding protein
VPQPDPDRRREHVAITGEVPSLLNRPSGCDFHTRCRYARPRCEIEVPLVTERISGRRFTCHFPLGETQGDAE